MANIVFFLPIVRKKGPQRAKIPAERVILMIFDLKFSKAAAVNAADKALLVVKREAEKVIPCNGLLTDSEILDESALWRGG